MNGPLEVFQQVANAMARNAWDEVASLCDPVSLSLFKRSQVARFTAEPTREWTAEDMMRHDPDLPREVAQYQVALMSKHQDQTNYLAAEFPGFRDAAALSKAAPATVFSVWLRGRSLEHLKEQAIALGQLPPAIVDAIRNEPDEERRLHAIGAVSRDAETAYVVCKWHYGNSVADEDNPDPVPDESGYSVEEIELQSLFGESPLLVPMRLQTDGEWRVVAKSDFLGLQNISWGFWYSPEETIE